MLQRYDIDRNEKTNRLSIKEFAVLIMKPRTRNEYKPIKKDYSFINEFSYDGDKIYAAIGKGQKAVISALRSDNFFPIHPLAILVAEEVTHLFDGGLDHFAELFFDDRTLLSVDNQKN